MGEEGEGSEGRRRSGEGWKRTAWEVNEKRREEGKRRRVEERRRNRSEGKKEK